jgi:hypothetical protein
MQVRVDSRHLESLRDHLAAQGFPAARVAHDVLDVLFPGSPALLAPAAALDDWLARETDGTVELSLLRGRRAYSPRRAR